MGEFERGILNFSVLRPKDTLVGKNGIQENVLFFFKSIFVSIYSFNPPNFLR